MKLSIISVNLNDSNGLRKTADSVFSQSFTDYEYIIIDGGSTDESVELIKAYSDKIDYWSSEQDTGIYNAMNEGIKVANGDYILFLNSGDWLADDNVLSYMFEQSDSEDIIFGDIMEIRSDGSRKYQKSLPVEKLTMANFYSNTHATVQHQASLIRRSLFDGGLYDESYRIIADIKFFIERIIMNNCSVLHIPLVVANFNKYGLSSNPSNWEKTIEERYRIFTEVLPPRIMKDYEILFQIKDSTLLEFIPFLEKTRGLNKLVFRIVSGIVKCYKIIYREN